MPKLEHHKCVLQWCRTTFYCCGVALDSSPAPARKLTLAGRNCPALLNLRFLLDSTWVFQGFSKTRGTFKAMTNFCGYISAPWCLKFRRSGFGTRKRPNVNKKSWLCFYWKDGTMTLQICEIIFQKFWFWRIFSIPKGTESILISKSLIWIKYW